MRWRSTLSLQLKHFDKALEFTRKAIEFTTHPNLAHEAQAMHRFCFNNGVSLISDQLYKEALQWLKLVRITKQFFKAPYCSLLFFFSDSLCFSVLYICISFVFHRPYPRSLRSRQLQRILRRHLIYRCHTPSLIPKSLGPIELFHSVT